MEAAAIASGQSFNGYDKETKEPRFNKLYSMDIHCTELGIFHRATIEGWNHPVQQWLKYCIHVRVPVKNQYVKMLTTFFVSALWHGFYPMYFYGFAFYFISAANFQVIFKLFVKYRILRNPVFYFLQQYVRPLITRIV